MSETKPKTAPAKKQFENFSFAQHAEEKEAKERNAETEREKMTIKDEPLEDGLFQITIPSGRKMIVKPLPDMFLQYHGELPRALTNRAIQALGKGASQADIDEYVESNITPEEEKRMTLMMREAVRVICVNPKLTLFPEYKDEMSPAELSAQDFIYLWSWATNHVGGEARAAATFRRK